MKIVVCDDSKAMRMIVMRMLKQTEFADAEFVQAEDGAQGLAAVREHEPDLIVSDWNMPNMDGLGQKNKDLKARMASDKKTRI